MYNTVCSFYCIYDLVSLSLCIMYIKQRYCCVVWAERDPTDEQLASLDAATELEIQQDTPIRVLHRRTGMVRPRVVHWMRHARIKPHFFKLWLNTAAGT